MALQEKGGLRTRLFTQHLIIQAVIQEDKPGIRDFHSEFQEWNTIEF